METPLTFWDVHTESCIQHFALDELFVSQIVSTEKIRSFLFNRSSLTISRSIISLYLPIYFLNSMIYYFSFVEFRSSSSLFHGSLISNCLTSTLKTKWVKPHRISVIFTRTLIHTMRYIYLKAIDS